MRQLWAEVCAKVRVLLSITEPHMSSHNGVTGGVLVYVCKFTHTVPLVDGPF